MATIYGVTPEGWYGKPFSVIIDEIDTDLLAILGDSAGTEPDGTIPLQSVAGQFKVMLADAYSAHWDLGGAIYASYDPNSASGAQLDAVCAQTGTTREAQTFSTAVETFTGTPGTVLLVGRKVKTSDTGAIFETTVQGTITALTAWVALTGYNVGDRRTNANRCYICTTAGTSAASGGPSTTGSTIADGSVVWKHLGAGTGAVDLSVEAMTAGAIGALAGTLTSIVTPVSGLSGAINLLDASVGALQETDPALRARREAELAGQGGSTADAIRAKILKVNEGSTDPAHQPPTSCTVFYNDSDVYDANGLPPHSVEILVQNGTDQDITQAVWNAVGAATAMYGNQSGVATDSQGNPQPVKWSRPVAVPIYATATIYYDASQWPAGANSLVAQAALSAFLTYGESFAIGLDARVVPLSSAIVTGPSATDSSGNAVVPAPAGSVAAPGILDVTLTIGTAPGPVASTPITISNRQLATFDSSRCVFTATAETP